MIQRYALCLITSCIVASALAQPPLDEVACYPFNGNANDGCGNNYDRTVFCSTLTTDRFGSANKAYECGGVLDHIKSPEWQAYAVCT